MHISEGSLIISENSERSEEDDAPEFEIEEGWIMRSLISWSPERMTFYDVTSQGLPIAKEHERFPTLETIAYNSLPSPNRDIIERGIEAVTWNTRPNSHRHEHSPINYSHRPKGLDLSTLLSMPYALVHLSRHSPHKLSHSFFAIAVSIHNHFK
jgi:hypothetical protein